MELRFGIDMEDADEVRERLSDLQMKFVINSKIPAHRSYTVTLYIDTYKDCIKAFYVVVMFAMLRDE